MVHSAGGGGQISGVQWPGSPAYLVSSRPFRDPISNKKEDKANGGPLATSMYVRAHTHIHTHTILSRRLEEMRSVEPRSNFLTGNLLQVILTGKGRELPQTQIYHWWTTEGSCYTWAMPRSLCLLNMTQANTLAEWIFDQNHHVTRQRFKFQSPSQNQ